VNTRGTALLRFCDVLEIVGDIVRVRVPDDTGEPVRFGDLAVLEDDGRRSLAQVIRLDHGEVSAQVFAGARGFSTGSRIRFPGRTLAATCSELVLGRVFSGTGEPIDGGPPLGDQPRVPLAGPIVNPVRRAVPSRMIRTNVPMIDVFNCLVESQKISIFSAAGEPYNELLARIGVQADADVVIFGGLGLIHDEFHQVRRAFEDAGVGGRTVFFANLASDSTVERLLVPDMALAVAERFALDQGRRVLVLLTDMTAFADALKEIGIAMEQVPSNRGYPGDLYSQLARRYERAVDFRKAGSVTLLTVTTMPGDDVTHPVPDNTGYITEGQFYLHEGRIDPFGSLSRLKQHVIGKETREDHGQIMNTMIRFYARARDAQQRQAMAFELTETDERLLRFGELFRERFMGIETDLGLEDALDLCWHTLAECFAPEELLMRRELVEKYYRAARP
jgi:V/A-type H+-transporting ATPase subunit B